VTILAFHSCNNSTLFLPLEEVTSRGLAPCAATISILGAYLSISGCKADGFVTNDLRTGRLVANDKQFIDNPENLQGRIFN
jgi:hypothetical protein